MDTISDRVMFLIKELGYSKSSFSKALGKRRVVIEGIVGKRGSKPNADTLAGIMQAFPEISADWLLTGRGKAFKIDIEKVNVEDFREKFLTQYIDKYLWNPEKDTIIKQLEQKIESLEAIIASRDKQLEDKDKTNAALQKLVDMLEEYKEKKNK